MDASVNAKIMAVRTCTHSLGPSLIISIHFIFLKTTKNSTAFWPNFETKPLYEFALEPLRTKEASPFGIGSVFRNMDRLAVEGPGRSDSVSDCESAAPPLPTLEALGENGDGDPCGPLPKTAVLRPPLIEDIFQSFYYLKMKRPNHSFICREAVHFGLKKTIPYEIKIVIRK